MITKIKKKDKGRKSLIMCLISASYHLDTQGNSNLLPRVPAQDMKE
jgi:hypothetical protein